MATLDDRQLEIPPGIKGGDALVASIEQCHAQAAQLLANERDAIASLLKRHLLERQAEWDQFVARARAKHRALVKKIRGKQDELAAGELELERAQAELRQTKRKLSQAEEELGEDKDQLARMRARLEEQRRQMEQDREKLADERSETKLQRRRIAREFKEQRTAHLAELDRLRAATALQRSAAGDASASTASADEESAELRRELAQLRKLLNARAEQLTELREQVKALHAERDALGEQHDRLSQELAVRDAIDSSDGRIADLTAERAQLRSLLADAEVRAEQGGSAGDQQRKLDLERRFEMAVQDIRELKKRNAELEARLASTPGNDRGGSPVGTGLDWESRKKRMLVELESEFDAEDEADAAERLTIEGTIRITDELVAEKDREIAELKHMLDHQSSSLGSVAVGAAAIAQIFDSDELIQQERQKLSDLQAECQAKLRQAEIDISLERAKIARDRAEIEEKLQSYSAAQARHGGEPMRPLREPAMQPDKPARGRWLSRLGLKNPEE